MPIFDALDYGLIEGGKTGNPALDVTIAQTNVQAFQAAANDFTASVKAGNADARYIFPAGDYLVCAVPTVGANWTPSLTGGWSHHSVVFDCGVFDLTEETFGGIIEGRGGRLIRIENDPLDIGNDTYVPPPPGGNPDGDDDEEFNSRGANNSTILVMGPWRGLAHVGLVEVEGYQVDSQMDGVRGPTSGDSWQFIFGVRGFTAEQLWGFKGTNSGFAINVNKRGQGSTAEAPVNGFDMSPDAICRDFTIGKVTAICGEHGGLLNSTVGIAIDEMNCYSLPYTFKGQLQRQFRQRGVYILCSQVYFRKFRCDDSHHVFLHISLRPDDRTAFDADVVIDEAYLTFAGRHEDDPDRYTGIEIVNNNSGVGALRRASLVIGKLYSRGLKILLAFREINNYADEINTVLRKLVIREIDSDTAVQGIFCRPRAGADQISIGRGRMAVFTGAGNTVAAPMNGLTVHAAAIDDMNRARPAPIMMSRLKTYDYTPPDALENGIIKYIYDWPGGAPAIISPTSLDAAGTATSTTNSTSISVTNVTAVVGDLLLLTVVSDNSASGGGSPIGTGSASDSAGNVWTAEILELNSQTGVANDGLVLAVWSCVVSNAMAGATVTVSLSATTKTKLATVGRIIGGVTGTFNILARRSGHGRGSSWSTDQIPIAAANHMLVVWGAPEANTPPAGDADTYLGSWTGGQTTTANDGTNLGSLTLRRQYKIVTGPGDQIYNGSTASGGGTVDWCWAYLVVEMIGTPTFAIYDKALGNANGWDNWRTLSPPSQIRSCQIGAVRIGSEALPARFTGISELRLDGTAFERLLGGTDPSVLTVIDAELIDGPHTQRLIASPMSNERITILSPRLSDMAALSASSGVPSLPVANLKNQEPSKVFRMEAGGQHIDIVLASAAACDAVAIAFPGSGLSSTATWRLRAWSLEAGIGTDPADLDSGEPQSIWPSGFRHISPNWGPDVALLRVANTIPYKYWRLDISDGDVSYIDIGRLALGIAVQFSLNFDADQGGLGTVPIDVVEPNGYGQTFTDARPCAQRTVDFGWAALAQKEVLEDAAELTRLRGQAGDVFCFLDPGEVEQFHRFSMQGLFSGSTRYAVKPVWLTDNDGVPRQCWGFNFSMIQKL